MLKQRSWFLLLLLMSSNAYTISWDAFKSINGAKIIDATEKAAFGAAFLLLSYQSWKQLIFNKRYTLEDLKDEEIAVIHSRYYYDFHTVVLNEAEVVDAEDFEIYPQNAGFLSAAVTNGLVLSCTALDNELITLEAYLEQEQVPAGDVILSLEQLLALYQRTDLPDEIHEALELILLYRAILYHEAGHYLHGDVTRLGALRSLSLQASIFAAGYIALHLAHKLVGAQQAGYWVDDSSKDQQKQGELFMQLHIFAVGGVFTGTLGLWAMAKSLYSQWQETRADTHAGTIATHYELIQFIRLWLAVDKQFTKDLEDALVIAYAYNGWLASDIDLELLAQKIGLEPDDRCIIYASHILHKYKKNENSRYIIRMPAGLTGDSPAIRGIFINTHPDHRDRAANGKRIYKERFGVEYDDIEIAQAATAAAA